MSIVVQWAKVKDFEGGGTGGEGVKRIQRCINEEQTATVLLNLPRMCVWLHYYYNIYLIETKEQQSGRVLPSHPSLQPKLARRGRRRRRVMK